MNPKKKQNELLLTGKLTSQDFGSGFVVFNFILSINISTYFIKKISVLENGFA